MSRVDGDHDIAPRSLRTLDRVELPVTLFQTLTDHLRNRRADQLEHYLTDVLVSGETEWNKDPRDLMVALAPIHDCATRIGADPAALFRRAAAAGPNSLRPLVEQFGARTDITPSAFAFTVVETPDGPEYQSTW